MKIKKKVKNSGGSRAGAGSPQKYDGGTSKLQTSVPTKALTTINEFITIQRELHKVKSS